MKTPAELIDELRKVAVDAETDYLSVIEYSAVLCLAVHEPPVADGLAGVSRLSDTIGQHGIALKKALERIHAIGAQLANP